MNRVVVTGLGAVSPHGRGVSRLWEGLRSNLQAIRELDLFDASKHRTQLAGQVAAEDVELCGAFAPGVRRFTRTDRFAVEAAREALMQAGLLDTEELASAGLFLGSSTGGMFEGEQVYLDLLNNAGRGEVSVRISRLADQPVCAPADAIVRTFGLHGPSETCATACAAATMSLEVALMSLRSGEVEVALAGGADGLCEMTYGGFNSLRAVSPAATRPFRQNREGLSLGEGAGLLVLETEPHARKRGATILGELAGTGTSCDAHHMTAPHPDGLGARLAMERALSDARVEASEIDFVNAHGTGTPHNDAAEWQALCAIFGERAAHLPVTSTKGSVGHLLGACGGLEAVVTMMCLSAGEVHPTPGGGVVDPECPVNLVQDEPLLLSNARTALSLNLAFGGANAAVILRRWPVEEDA